MRPEAIPPVRLVGAGPGPADLLTLRAVRAIEGAEALLYDALVGEEVLALAPRACLKIQTGKRAGRASMKQETINRLMARLARRGLRARRHPRRPRGDPLARDTHTSVDRRECRTAKNELASEPS